MCVCAYIFIHISIHRERQRQRERERERQKECRIDIVVTIVARKNFAPLQGSNTFGLGSAGWGTAALLSLQKLGALGLKPKTPRL